MIALSNSVHLYIRPDAKGKFLEFFTSVLGLEARAVPPYVSGPCMRKSVEGSAMRRFGYCMQLVSAIVAHVHSASSVKNRRPPSKRDGSVPSIGLSLHLHRSQVSLRLHRRALHLHRLLIQCSGETGNGAPIGVRW